MTRDSAGVQPLARSCQAKATGYGHVPISSESQRVTMSLREHMVHSHSQQTLHGFAAVMTERLQQPVLLRWQVERERDLFAFQVTIRGAARDMHDTLQVWSPVTYR